MAEFRSPPIIPFSAGIIAAGDGTRLRARYPQTTKPLLPIRGAPLIHWTAFSLISAGAREIILLLNSHGRKVPEYLQRQGWPVRWDFREADTASSWESFRLVARALADKYERFLISTVDALVPQQEILRFVETAFKTMGPNKPAAALALTRFVEDEKPLWADVDNAGRITALGPASRQRELITCGLYALNRPLAQSLQKPQVHSSLREFWGAAVNNGVPVTGIPLAKTVDVDRPEDVATAEKFVASWGIPA
jgi:NDP-sugar pyrophosphorylase family protein